MIGFGGEIERWGCCLSGGEGGEVLDLGGGLSASEEVGVAGEDVGEWWVAGDGGDEICAACGMWTWIASAGVCGGVGRVGRRDGGNGIGLNWVE